MKTLIKLFAALAAMIVALVAIIKIVHGGTWKEAVGIAEEFWNEIRESSGCCHKGKADQDEVPGEA